jgi:2-phosphosulfolactate phosphatase
LRIEIVKSLQGLDKLKGAVVILDVFRASNTIIALLASGVKQLVLLADLEEARRLKARRPGWLLLGERQGIAPPDFDGGNSPVAAETGAFSGRRVILTTSAGTQAVGRLSGAGLVVFSSFANAGALVAMLKKLGPMAVHLLPMGLEAKQPALEDELAASYLADLLVGREPDFAGIKARLLACGGADRLRSLEQQADLEFCTTLDSHGIIPRVRFGELPEVDAYPDT